MKVADKVSNVARISLSKDFLVLDADLVLATAQSIIEAGQPRYLIVSRLRDGSRSLYVVYAPAFLDLLGRGRAKSPANRSIGDFLNLRETEETRVLELPADPNRDLEAREILGKELPSMGFLVAERRGRILGIYDPHAERSSFVHGLPGSMHEFPPELADSALGRRQRLPAEDLRREVAQEQPQYVERFPFAAFPSSVPLGKRAQLLVRIQVSPGFADRPAIRLLRERGEPVIPVLVLVKATGFELEGEYHREVVVPIDASESEAAVFNLKATSVGWQTIRIELLSRGAYAGSLELKTKIVSSEEGSEVKPRYITGRALGIEMVPGPDLVLLIYEKSANSEFVYDVCLQSAVLGKPLVRYGPIRFRGDPESKFLEIFKDIEENDLEADLKSKGQDLYKELIPGELQDLYWSFRKRVKSVQVISDEPWIPWEILRPWRATKQGVQEDPPLCESFAFSRWIEGHEVFGKERIRAMKIVVPDDTDLEMALAERDWVREFGQRVGMKVSHASNLHDVLLSLQHRSFDLLHFSTHGTYDQAYPNLSGILLENKDKLRPENLNGRSVIFGRRHPIVVLNACQTGSRGFSLTRLGGWVEKFLDAGASAFIGTLWSVSDETSYSFTRALYEQLSRGFTIGNAVRSSRKAARRRGDPSWLAYQYFGNPNTVVKIGTST